LSAPSTRSTTVLEATYRVQDEIAVTKAKLTDEQAVKAEIADTKRRIQLELERVRTSLTTEKAENHKADLTIGRLERVQRRVDHKVREEESALRSRSATKTSSRSSRRRFATSSTTS
jgi:hypothetical protein